MSDETTSNQVATVDAAGDNPFAAYGRAADRSVTFLRFEKGSYTYGPDQTELPVGTELAADMINLRVGHLKWIDGRPVAEQMTRLASGEAPTPRTALGDNDPETWGTDKNGQRRDPWAPTNTLPLRDPKTGAEYLFSTSSRGGIGAVARLCRDYGTAIRTRPGMVPIVKIGVDSYRHESYGKVIVPTLDIAEWAREDDLIAGVEGNNGKTKDGTPSTSCDDTHF